MRHYSRLLSVGLVAILALAPGAHAASGPTVVQDEDRIVMMNDHVALWLRNGTPTLLVMPAALAADAAAAADAAGGKGAAAAPETETDVPGAFAYRLASLVEYRDLDGNGVPAPHETLARLDLAKATYETTILEEDGLALVNLTITAPVALGGAAPELALPGREATVSILFALRAADAVVDAAGTEVPVPATSARYDVVVASWPWTDAADGRLALETVVSGFVETDRAGDVVTASVTRGGEAVGALAWTLTASGTDAAGETVEVPVKPMMRPRADESAEETTLLYTFDAPGLASLAYGASVGVSAAAAAGAPGAEVPDLGERIKSVPAPGAAVGLVVLGAAAVAVARRRG